ncbi:MAG: hypothetical protein MJA29_01515, partial [Candidatus Omnitrophica bacterium]|nr:hypothetical protein [Candidatus Omnitrophota bacterium]
IENKGKGIPMIEATFITKTQEAKAVYLENKPYVKITYNTDGYTRGVLSTGHEIPIHFDNGANCNIIPKAYYDQHPELHHYPKSTHDVPPVNTGGGYIKSHFWMDILVTIQGAQLQLKCLVTESLTNTGLLFSRISLEQLQTKEDYTAKCLYIADKSLPLISTVGVSIPPKQNTYFTCKIATNGSTDINFSGQTIVWIKTAKQEDPLQPVVAHFNQNYGVIMMKNNTQFAKGIKANQIIGYADIRSKDGSLAYQKWLIPMNSKGDYIYFGHSTFASSIDKQPLATENIADTADCKLEYLAEGSQQQDNIKETADPYPWLDHDDPRRNLTDRQILEQKIPIDKTVLNKEE